jgi:DNA-binding NarL/FixJ family response regulator
MTFQPGVILTDDSVISAATGTIMGMAAKIRVLLADDQTLVRTGFRVILETEGDIEVVAEADTGREAIRQAQLAKPDVILMETTVKTHVARILAKLGLRDRVQAVVLAYETGYVTRSQGS